MKEGSTAARFWHHEGMLNRIPEFGTDCYAVQGTHATVATSNVTNMRGDPRRIVPACCFKTYGFPPDQDKHWD